VRDAVESWLTHGLTGRQESTVVNRTILARTHVIPALGARKLAQLSAEEVDQWLAAKAQMLSTDTLHRLLSILRQSIREHPYNGKGVSQGIAPRVKTRREGGGLPLNAHRAASEPPTLPPASSENQAER
jgi:Phage integrase, N-terminal SAM-like domain